MAKLNQRQNEQTQKLQKLLDKANSDNSILKKRADLAEIDKQYAMKAHREIQSALTKSQQEVTHALKEVQDFKKRGFWLFGLWVLITNKI